MKTDYICSFCNFKTNYRGDFKRHTYTKKHKRNIESSSECGKKPLEPAQTQHKPAQIFENPAQIQHKPAQTGINQLKINCEFCAKSFKSQDNLTRHLKKFCKQRKDKENELEEIKVLLEEEREIHKKEKQRLYDCIDRLIEKAGNTTTTITNNTQNNIHLNSYGKEDLSHITDKLKMEFLKLPYGMIPKMIEQVHFSQIKPENSNIALTNKKEKFIKIFKDGKWQYFNKEEILDDLIQTNYCRLDGFYEDSCEGKMPQLFESRYKKFQTKFDDDDQKLKDQIKKDSVLLLMNENLKTGQD
jgi:hypothetical protein